MSAACWIDRPRSAGPGRTCIGKPGLSSRLTVRFPASVTVNGSGPSGCTAEMLRPSPAMVLSSTEMRQVTWADPLSSTGSQFGGAAMKLLRESGNVSVTEPGWVTSGLSIRVIVMDVLDGASYGLAGETARPAIPDAIGMVALPVVPPMSPPMSTVKVTAAGADDCALSSKVMVRLAPGSSGGSSQVFSAGLQLSLIHIS